MTTGVGIGLSHALFSLAALAVAAFAIWHRSTIGWIVTAEANALAAWLVWQTLQ